MRARHFGPRNVRLISDIDAGGDAGTGAEPTLAMFSGILSYRHYVSTPPIPYQAYQPQSAQSFSKGLIANCSSVRNCPTETTTITTTFTTLTSALARPLRFLPIPLPKGHLSDPPLSDPLAQNVWM
jgi:hypothetical protein